MGAAAPLNHRPGAQSGHGESRVGMGGRVGCVKTGQVQRKRTHVQPARWKEQEQEQGVAAWVLQLP